MNFSSVNSVFAFRSLTLQNLCKQKAQITVRFNIQDSVNLHPVYGNLMNIQS